MRYAIELTETAWSDIRDTTRWLRDTASEPVARKWLADLFDTISTLSETPLLHPLAFESDRFPVPVREMLHGKGRRGRYRILYMVDGSTVTVLYIRRSARDEISP